MFSGGAWTQALVDQVMDLRERQNALRRQMERLNGRKDDVQEDVSDEELALMDARNAHSDAAEDLSEQRGEKSTAESDFRTEKADARNKKDRLTAKEEKNTEYWRSIDELERRLQTSIMELRQAEEAWQLSFRMYVQQVTDDQEVASLQAIAENQIAGLDILVNWMNTSLKMNDAQLGTRAASGTRSEHDYFTIPQRARADWLSLKNQYETQAARVEDLKKQIDEKKADTYTQDEVADAKKELAESEAKRDELEAKYEKEKAKLEELKVLRDKAKTAMEEQQRKLRNVQSILREYDAKIRKKQDKIADNNSEQSNIDNEARIEEN